MRLTSGRITGALIGGTFGAAFVLANANTALGARAAVVFRVLAIAGLAGLYAAARRVRSRVSSCPSAASEPGRVSPFGRRYWLIVAAEVAVLGIGIGLLRAFGTPQPTNVAWIALMVGLHFIAFRCAGVWEGSVARAAGLLIALGLAGFGLVAASDPRWTSFVSGVLSGLVLLIGSLYVIAHELVENRAGSDAARDSRLPPPRRSDPARVR